MSRKNNKSKRSDLRSVGEFEIVSYEEFAEHITSAIEDARWNELGYWEKLGNHLVKKWCKPDVSEEKLLQMYQKSEAEFAYQSLVLPQQATKDSAGFDFKAPFTFTLKSGQTLKIPTGIRVKINRGWWLACMPRSSTGFKYRCQLDNTVGVIDGDYYYSDNEGHIFLKITNDSKGIKKKDMTIKMGEGFAQGIFLPYGVTYSSCPTNERNGGFGSTDEVE